MADDGLERFEAALGAISKITSDDKELVGARCPKCEASDFARVSDLYSEAIGRLEDEPDSGDVIREGGMTDRQMAGKFAPPPQKSPFIAVIGVAIPLAAGAVYVYRRYGDWPGEVAAVVGVVVTVVVLMTSIRRVSDQYYSRRRRWRSLHMCKKCGQLVAS